MGTSQAMLKEQKKDRYSNIFKRPMWPIRLDVALHLMLNIHVEAVLLGQSIGAVIEYISHIEEY